MDTVTSHTSPEAQLRAENAGLRARLEKAEAALRAEGLSVEGGTDITERKRREEEFQRVSVLLDTLLHTAPIGFCFLDRDLRYVRINERLAEINGIPAEAHLGRHVSEIVPALVETLRDVTGRILATGEAVLNHEFSGETPAAPGVTRFWSESLVSGARRGGRGLGFRRGHRGDHRAQAGRGDDRAAGPRNGRAVCDDSDRAVPVRRGAAFRAGEWLDGGHQRALHRSTPRAADGRGIGPGAGRPY